MKRQESAPTLDPIVLKRKKKIKKHLGFTALAVFPLFFFLPDLAIFDFLPDFIGYIILLCGLSQLRDLNDYLGNAYDRFYKIAWISAARFLSFFVTLGLVTPQERPDTMLLIAFVFGIFDFIFLIPAWRDLFEGISYLVTRCDGVTFDVVLRKPKTVRRNNPKKGLRRGDKIERKPYHRIEGIRKLTIFFVGMKTVLNVLPEFAALTADTEISTVFRLYDYIAFLRGGAMIAVVAVGIVWFVRMVRFARAVKKDLVFIEFYREKYRTDVLTKEHIFVHRHLQNALFLASIAVVFRVDIRMDHMHMIPDALMAILLLISAALLGMHVAGRRKFTVAAIVYAVCSFAVGLFEYYFYYNYSVTSIQTSEESRRVFSMLCGAKLAEQVLFVGMFVLFLVLLRSVVRSHTGFAVTEQETRTPSEKIRSIHKDLEKQLKISLVFAAVTAVSKALLIFLALETRPECTLEWLPAVDILVSAVFAFFTIRTVRAIYSQVEYRFMLL